MNGAVIKWALLGSAGLLVMVFLGTRVLKALPVAPPPVSLERPATPEQHRIDTLQAEVTELKAAAKQPAPEPVQAPIPVPAGVPVSPPVAPVAVIAQAAVVDAGSAAVAAPIATAEASDASSAIVQDRIETAVEDLSATQSARVERRRAAAEATTQLRLAGDQLLQGNTDGVAQALDQAEQAFTGPGRDEVRAARLSLQNEDLGMTREHLARAIQLSR